MATWWDDSHNWCAAVDGYEPFGRDRQGQGSSDVVLCVRESFDCLELLHGDDREVCLWVMIRSKANKIDIMVRVLDHSTTNCWPLFSRGTSTYQMSARNTIKQKENSSGGFWMCGWWLPDITGEWTSYRSYPSGPDREGLVDDTIVGGYLGHKDHKMIVFDLWISKDKDQLNCYLGLMRGFGLFRRPVDRILWVAVLKDEGVQKEWVCLNKGILKVQKQGEKKRERKRGVYDLWKKGQAPQED